MNDDKPRPRLKIVQDNTSEAPAVPAAVPAAVQDAVPAAVQDASQRLAKEINQDAIEIVEGLLERLKSGESVAAAIVEVHSSRSVATHWSETHGSYHHLCSGAARLAFRLTADED